MRLRERHALRVSFGRIFRRGLRFFPAGRAFLPARASRRERLRGGGGVARAFVVVVVDDSRLLLKLPRAKARRAKARRAKAPLSRGGAMLSAAARPSASERSRFARLAPR
jgi:hypothetical protein